MNKGLRREIIRRGEELYTLLKNGDYTAISAKRDQLFNPLEEAAQRHSLEIEEPSRSLKRRVYDALLTNLKSAWDYAKKNEFSTDTLKAVNGLILLGNPNEVRFRDSAAFILGDEVKLPPRAEKIENELRKVSYDYNVFKAMAKQDQVNALELAAYLHLQIARIHPFFDGNGRSARIIQNGTLARYFLPPAIINDTESVVYFRMLKRAINDLDGNEGRIFDEECRSPENDSMKWFGEFVDFIGSKVAASMDQIIDASKNHQPHVHKRKTSGKFRKQ